MIDQIRCSKCHEINGIYRFCIHCGYELFNEDMLKAFNDKQSKFVNNKQTNDNIFKVYNENPAPYCLNCGRPVKKGQNECGCGNEFRDIHCHKCNTLNEYTNRFCTSCGNKLWVSNVFYYNYPKKLFERYHFIKETLPRALHNTSLYGRPKCEIDGIPSSNIKLEYLEDLAFKLEEYLCEIESRWKIISPDYCINCLCIINSSQDSCYLCNHVFTDKTRVDFIKTHKYIKPKFDNVELKWTPKNNNNYLSSLSPAFGESQFEYRERLKWEFSENKYLKSSILNEINNRKKRNEQREREEAYMKLYGGGYCSSNCRYYYEEWLDSRGAITGSYEDMRVIDEYCHLGHSLHTGRFCKDYKK